MNEINLYLLDMTNELHTSGVNRYMNTLLTGLENYPFICVYRIQLLRGAVLFHKEEKKKYYTQATIPLPQLSNEIINERYWLQKYNEQVFSLIRHLFENKPNRIIHIHTLNLIALASYINSQLPCKIITHLHCLPWKDHYNQNQKKFNSLYAAYYLEKNKIPEKELFFTNNCEWESYTVPDKIICVTQCAKHFLQKVMNVPNERIAVIDNGINDLGSDVEKTKKQQSSGVFQCLFVGVHTESKGIFYILQTLRKVQKQGYKVCLNTAGAYSSKVYKQITEEYSDLQVNLLGRISFEDLQRYYRESDAGIIASLQEQCSYAAIEMAMFGLPVITTEVDGLDEMFTDGVDALKVNTRFSKVFGLSVDTDMLAEKIIALIENDELRRQLGVNARKLYQERFNLENMMEQTVAVYKKLLGREKAEVKPAKKQSVLFSIDSLNSGGAEKVLINILQSIDYEQFEVDLLIIFNLGVYFDRIPPQVNWFTLRNADSYRFKQYDVEIAFQEGYSTKHIAHRKSDALKIAWVHCDLYNFHWTTGFYKNDAEEQWCYSQMNKIVFVSKQSLQNFGQLFPDIQNEKQVIHNPIDREEILAASQQLTIQKNKLTLCCVGRLIECKGYLRLIPILSRLINEGFGFECWLIGEGDQQKEIEKLIRQYSLEQVVLLKGFQHNPYPYIAASDIVVSASFTESYSLVLCEALCLGKPMLVTQVSGAEEIVGDCGLIVSQEEQAIYEGLKRLIKDKNLRKQLSQKALARSKILFDQSKIMNQIFDLMKRTKQPV